MVNPLNEKYIIGTLRMHPKGFGFVQPQHDQAFSSAIFIPKRFIYDAIDKDVVEVEINDFISEKGAEGKIHTIIERARTALAARIEDYHPEKGFLLYSPLLGVEKKIYLKSKVKLDIGDAVLVSLKKRKKGGLYADLIEKIGSIDDPSIDIPFAAKGFQLHETFSKAAIKEAKQFGSKVNPIEVGDREDLTELTCITIDPDTAKDFDDAISIFKKKNGDYQLGVHIADVAYYVKPGSALDKEAYMRANSTYFPGKVLPMLPHELSSHLCSLKPNVLRLAVSVIMDFSSKGELKNYQIKRSVIESRKRFTYEEAFDVLEKKVETPFYSMLVQMKTLAKKLKQLRHKRGSIDFALPEAKIYVDDKGNPEEIRYIEYDMTHQMIEEFMLKANEVIATHLTKKNKTAIYRVHEEPSKDNLEEFYQQARACGFPLKKAPTTEDLQQLFAKASKTQYLELLSIRFIRSMRLAIYSSENLGHYGLALDYYCHFTSPIRRYSDLIALRLLFNEVDKDINIDQIAKHCSERERDSFRAEVDVTVLKKLRLLNQSYEQNPKKVYTAKITLVKPQAIFFEVEGFAIEGVLHVSALYNDYFIFDEKMMRLIGRRTKQVLESMKKIELRLIDIDLIHQQTKWELFLPKRGKGKK